MSIESAFAPAEAAYKELVMRDTWGHLAPKSQTTYTGYVLFTLGCYGDIVVINYEFNDDHHNELPGSPWFADDLMDFVVKQIDQVEGGTILRFEGSYRKFKNGKSRFSGSILQCSAPHLSQCIKNDYEVNRRRHQR